MANLLCAQVLIHPLTRMDLPRLFSAQFECLFSQIFDADKVVSFPLLRENPAHLLNKQIHSAIYLVCRLQVSVSSKTFFQRLFHEALFLIEYISLKAEVFR